MDLPKIELSSLPDLDTLTGTFGSLVQAGREGGDHLVVLMTYLYEILPPGGG